MYNLCAECSVVVFAASLGMPREACVALSELDERINSSNLLGVVSQSHGRGLVTSKNLGIEWNRIKQSIHESGEDKNPWIYLYVMLFIALHFTLPEYRKSGIEDEIFADTMRAFSRFVRENKKRYGNYSFDREFWTYRQLALRIFRMGTLEYELSTDKQNAYISIHIPSDADLLPSLRLRGLVWVVGC